MFAFVGVNSGWPISTLAVTGGEFFVTIPTLRRKAYPVKSKRARLWRHVGDGRAQIDTESHGRRGTFRFQIGDFKRRKGVKRFGKKSFAAWRGVVRHVAAWCGMGATVSRP